MAISLFYKVLEIAKSENGQNEQTIKDLVALTKNELATNKDKGMVFAKHLKMFLGGKMQDPSVVNKQFFYDCYFNVLVAETPYSLDSYFQALEWNRPIKERFYLPRRKQLLNVVKDLEDLIINKTIDEYFLSLPARVGKTTLTLFLMSWIIGMNSELSNLYCSCSGTLVDTFYKGLTEILNDDTTYLWGVIFKNTKWDKLTFTNSKQCYLDTGRVKRYHSFTGRSIDAESLNGACDCNGLLVADDLVSGIEEALNKERLWALNLKVNNNLLTRAKMGAKILWIGTRWSIADPIGVRIESLANTNKRCRVVVRPALNENEESNFDYLYGVGFDSQYYKDRKQAFLDMDDEPSWLAQYQGQPIERTGLLFSTETLKYYNGVLPNQEPTRIFGFCDVAWGGGDYTCLPVIYQYDDVCYCVDFVCDKGEKNITIPKVINAIKKYNMTSVQFEKNSGGENYKEEVEKALIKDGVILNITTKSAFSIQKKNANSKETHIFEKAPEIREIYFLESSKRNGDYKKAIEMLTSYTINGKNKNDDVPDALAGCMDMKNEITRKATFEILRRLF